jgi:hypothetical protein
MKVSSSSIRKLIGMGVNPDQKDFAILAAQMDIDEIKKDSVLKKPTLSARVASPPSKPDLHP